MRVCVCVCFGGGGVVVTGDKTLILLERRLLTPQLPLGCVRKMTGSDRLTFLTTSRQA